MSQLKLPNPKKIFPTILTIAAIVLPDLSQAQTKEFRRAIQSRNWAEVTKEVRREISPDHYSMRARSRDPWVSGTGNCTDVAFMLYKEAIQAGVPRSNLAFVYGYVYGQNPHIALLIKDTEGSWMVVDPNQMERIVPLKNRVDIEKPRILYAGD